MKFITLTVGKSQNPNTGEHWYKVDGVVSVGENEDPDQVFAEAKRRIDGWLPNPFGKNETSVYLSEPPYHFSKNEEPTREDEISGYLEIIKLANSSKILEKHRGNINRLNDPGLTNSFNLKLDALANQSK